MTQLDVSKPAETSARKPVASRILLEAVTKALGGGGGGKNVLSNP